MNWSADMAELEAGLPPARAERLATGAKLVDAPGPPPPPPPPPPPEGGGGGRRRKKEPEEPWMEDLSYSRDGIRAEVGNVVRILGRHPDWKGLLRWNQFAMQIEFARQPPFPRPRDLAEDAHMLGEEDITRVRLWLSNLGAYFGKDLVADALPVLAQEHSYHPVRDYLGALEWDGVRRVETWLVDYAGAADTPYVRQVAKWWLVSMVARVRQPGCKADTVPILEGIQGKGKSTLCSTLAVRPEWFSDTETEIGNKDSRVSLRGRWLIEFGELTSLTRREVDRVKQYLSQRDDKYRLPYARVDTIQPRQVVFCGTVNPEEGLGYLKDPTGARRFWPFGTGEHRLQELARDRDLLWAEAVALYEAGERWWAETLDEKRLCQAEQAERRERDPWEDSLETWVTKQEDAHRMAQHARFPEPDPTCLICCRATCADALAALGVATQNQDQNTERRVVRAMAAIGWEKRRTRVGKGLRYCFHPVGSP